MPPGRTAAASRSRIVSTSGDRARHRASDRAKQSKAGPKRSRHHSSHPGPCFRSRSSSRSSEGVNLAEPGLPVNPIAPATRDHFLVVTECGGGGGSAGHAIEGRFMAPEPTRRRRNALPDGLPNRPPSQSTRRRTTDEPWPATVPPCRRPDHAGSPASRPARRSRPPSRYARLSTFGRVRGPLTRKNHRLPAAAAHPFAVAGRTPLKPLRPRARASVKLVSTTPRQRARALSVRAARSSMRSWGILAPSRRKSVILSG